MDSERKGERSGGADGHSLKNPHLLGALLVSKRALDGEGAAARGRGRGGGRRRRLLLGGAEGGGQEAGAGESQGHGRRVSFFFFFFEAGDERQREWGRVLIFLPSFFFFLCHSSRDGGKLSLSLGTLSLLCSSIREDRDRRALDATERAQTVVVEPSVLRPRTVARIDVALSLVDSRKRKKAVERRPCRIFFKTEETEEKNGDAAHLQQQVAPPGDQVPRAVYDPGGAAGQGEKEDGKSRGKEKERETKSTESQTALFFLSKRRNQPSLYHTPRPLFFLFFPSLSQKKTSTYN